MARILIVDDSAATRMKMKLILIQAGHTVVAEAVNGMQAYREYEKHLPDLVTMDITMPIMDGISAVKRIIDIFSDARIVVVSAISQKNQVFAALQSGAKNYIIKPVESDKVIAVVNKVLSEAPVKSGIPKNTFSQPEPVDHAKGYFTQPFRLDNHNGMFVISISKDISHQSIRTLNTSLEDMLSANSGKIVLDFGDIGFLENDVLEDIASIMIYFTRLYKSVIVVASNESFAGMLKSKKIEVFDTVYRSISEIPMVLDK